MKNVLHSLFDRLTTDAVTARDSDHSTPRRARQARR